MKKTRQLHLWIGLICSVFILIESVTGLLLSERWLMGSGGAEMRPPQSVSQNAQDANGASADQSAAVSPKGDRPAFQGGDNGGSNNVMGIVRGLHEGRIGNTDVKWLVDLTAVGMIFLTATGITLSIKTLRAQAAGRKKRSLAEA